MNLFSEIQSQRANGLLQLLNADLKEKDKYAPLAIYSEKGLDVYICTNREKDILFNVLDFEGKFPNGFSACWRNFQHIKEEFKNLK